ncbi:MAG: alpha/beta fold hydrolase [Lachnospiraceae bacterium]|nr:alpha/beta fold hydrolase [Lachnospiraceae bacterium]
MKPGWIVLIALIIILLVLFVIIVDWMTRYAYDRSSPKLPKFLVNILMGNRPIEEEQRQKIHDQAASLKEKANPTVFMTSFDGEVMAGHYYPCENAKRLVIASHGWRSGWNYDYRTIAPFLHEHETSILMLDLRGHGESGGRYLYYGKKERYDISGWTDYAARELAPKLPIYVMGMSVGALSTIMSTTAGLHPDTKGVILDSCAGSARAFGMSVIKNMKIDPRFLYPFIRLDARLRLGMDDNAYTAQEAVEENTLPILFIHGTADVVADIHSMEKLYEKCDAPKFCLIVEGAGHIQSCFVEPEQYQKSLLDFFAFCEQ